MPTNTLFLGARVEGTRVIVATMSNDTARQLCREIIAAYTATETVEPVVLSEARVLAIAEEAGVLYEGPDRCDFDGAFEPMSLRTLTRIVNLGRSALAAPSQAGRDAVEAAAERAIEHALETAGVRLSLGYVLAVDAGMQLFQKFSRAALSTPTGRAAE